MDILLEYWFWPTMIVGLVGAYFNERYGFWKSRFWRWVWPFMFWISAGGVIPNMLESLSWAGPLLGGAIGLILFSLSDFKNWLRRKEINKRRRDRS